LAGRGGPRLGFGFRGREFEVGGDEIGRSRTRVYDHSERRLRPGPEK
jgi:hypothetical protein